MLKEMCVSCCVQTLQHVKVLVVVDLPFINGIQSLYFIDICDSRSVFITDTSLIE